MCYLGLLWKIIWKRCLWLLEIMFKRFDLKSRHLSEENLIGKEFGRDYTIWDETKRRFLTASEEDTLKSARSEWPTECSVRSWQKKKDSVIYVPLVQIDPLKDKWRASRRPEENISATKQNNAPRSNAQEGLFGGLQDRTYYQPNEQLYNIDKCLQPQQGRFLITENLAKQTHTNKIIPEDNFMQPPTLNETSLDNIMQPQQGKFSMPVYGGKQTYTNKIISEDKFMQPPTLNETSLDNIMQPQEGKFSMPVYGGKQTYTNKIISEDKFMQPPTLDEISLDKIMQRPEGKFSMPVYGGKQTHTNKIIPEDNLMQPSFTFCTSIQNDNVESRVPARFFGGYMTAQTTRRNRRLNRLTGLWTSECSFRSRSPRGATHRAAVGGPKYHRRGSHAGRPY